MKNVLARDRSTLTTPFKLKFVLRMALLQHFESAWIYPNVFPTIVESFVEVLGERGHLHFDRKRESIELSTEQAFTYPKTLLTANVFGTLRGAFPSCLDDFVSTIHEDRNPRRGSR